MTSTLSAPRTAMNRRRPGCTDSTVQRGATLSTLNYDDAGNLTVDNANGNRVTYQYGSTGRPTTQADHNSGMSSFSTMVDGNDDLRTLPSVGRSHFRLPA